MVMRINNQDILSALLLQKNLISAEALETLGENAKLFQQTLFQHIMQNGSIDAEKMANACADYFQSQVIMPSYDDFCFDKVTEETLKTHLLLPMLINKQYIIAISDPNDREFASTLSFQLKSPVKIRWMRYDFLVCYHNHYYSDSIYNSEKAASKVIAEQLLSDAIHQKASDIHLEPYQHFFRIRFRLDGLLHTIKIFPNTLSEGILSCLKVLAGLDIAIKRMPQDGRFSFRTYLGFYKNCRVSTCPTTHGEKIVIRLLDHTINGKNISELGLLAEQEKIIQAIIQKPQGLILVTGPTGSGKSITLYTLLNILNKTHRNIVTIEDPIEMQIEGINQTQANHKTGLSFSHTLRALLRQDPDIIMIGEIRDDETAEMAIRAAQTGHLVLSTLHTNSAAEAITRLHHMGIDSFHLGSALSLVIAQRLARKLCIYCDKKGCKHCYNGYHGRIGIFELLPINDAMRQAILAGCSHIDIAKQNEKEGHSNLWASAMHAIDKQKTTLEEITRVIL